MSLQAKIRDLKVAKGDNEKWYCYQVPEEFHFWMPEHPWKEIEKYNVRPIKIKVSGRASTNNVVPTKFTEKRPLLLKCGVSATGQHTIAQSQSVHFEIRVDGTREINTVLDELSKKYKITQFTVEQLQVSNPYNILLHAERHNPDTNGTSLYIVKFFIDGNEKYYLNVSLGKMTEYVGEFKNCIAQCANTYDLVPVCAIQHKVKGNQAKLRKK